MRHLLTLFMILGLLVGVNARVLALDCGPEEGCCEVAESCCVELHDRSLPQGNHHEGDGCPVEHHHHACCTHGFLLGAEEPETVQPASLESRLPELRPEGDPLPDDPFLGSEKPPLI